MASKSVTLSTTAYTKLDTTTESAVFTQVVEGSEVAIIFAAAEPALNAGGKLILSIREAVSRNGATSDMWALNLGNGTARVVVVE